MYPRSLSESGHLTTTFVVYGARLDGYFLRRSRTMSQELKPPINKISHRGSVTSGEVQTEVLTNTSHLEGRLSVTYTLLSLFSRKQHTSITLQRSTNSIVDCEYMGLIFWGLSRGGLCQKTIS